MNFRPTIKSTAEITYAILIAGIESMVCGCASVPCPFSLLLPKHRQHTVGHHESADNRLSKNWTAERVAPFRCWATSCRIGDTDLSGGVDVDDLLNVLLAWGSTGIDEPTFGINTNVDRVGGVTIEDLDALLANWGRTCPTNER